MNSAVGLAAHPGDAVSLAPTTGCKGEDASSSTQGWPHGMGDAHTIQSMRFWSVIGIVKRLTASSDSREKRGLPPEARYFLAVAFPNTKYY